MPTHTYVLKHKKNPKWKGRELKMTEEEANKRNFGLLNKKSLLKWMKKIVSKKNR